MTHYIVFIPLKNDILTTVSFCGHFSRIPGKRTDEFSFHASLINSFKKFE